MNIKIWRLFILFNNKELIFKFEDNLYYIIKKNEY